MKKILVKSVPVKNSAQIINELNAMPGVEYIGDTGSNRNAFASQLILTFNDGRWTFLLPDSTAKVSIDFADLVADHRLVKSNVASELVVKAVRGRKPFSTLSVIDATAGLGRDSFILAAAGCRVSMVERIPLLAFLLKEALLSAVSFSTSRVALAASRIHCVNANSAELFANWQGEKPEVIYLDPMYAENASGKISNRGASLKISAAVKKQTQLLHCLNAIYIAHATVDQQSTVENNKINVDQALLLATKKVVVKRAPKAEWLDGLKPTSSLTGKSVRFDIYAC